MNNKTVATTKPMMPYENPTKGASGYIKQPKM